MNLKPGPSQLSKQKQRLAQADEYSSPQKSNPTVPLHPPRSQGPPGITKLEDGIPRDVWDWGARGPLSSVFQLFSVWLHSGTIAKALPSIFSSKEA